MIYKKLIRPMVFRLTKDDPEIAHEWAIKLLQIVGNDRWLRKAMEKFCRVNDDRLDQKVFGLRFPNPVGLAAGFDKNGQAIRGLTSLGFGFITTGTVTPRDQKGNDRPRIFRLPEDRALINRMGFNNFGATALALRLSASENGKIPIGASIGKMRDTNIDNAVDDYLYCLRSLCKYVDFIEQNISSPNTPGLRLLQHKHYLDKLFFSSNMEMARLGKEFGIPFRPMIPKLDSDMEREQLNDFMEVAEKHRIPGVILINTTVKRHGLRSKLQESGGLSGEPLRERALEIVRYISQSTRGTLPIIGVGGISTPEDAYEMLRAGASLIQILTGFIYEGPFVARNINRGLVKIFEKEGIRNISEIRGGKRNEKIGKCHIVRRQGCQPHY